MANSAAPKRGAKATTKAGTKAPAAKAPAAKAPATKASPHRRSAAGSNGAGWIVLIYKVPSEPSRVRVRVWREIKRMGALYLQQAVAIFPNRPEVVAELDGVRERITSMQGTYYYFEIAPMDEGRENELIDGFRDLSSREYAEIVEECETKFLKEIEFERFRNNYTFEESEEIRQDLEKIRRWFVRVKERDWFAAEGRDEVDAWLKRCESELEDFEEEIYDKTGGGEDSRGQRAGASPRTRG